MQPNEKVGRLTLLEPRQVGKTKKWLCRCDCGGTTIVLEQSLRARRSNSCGCLRRQRKDAVMGAAFSKGGRP